MRLGPVRPQRGSRARAPLRSRSRKSPEGNVATWQSTFSALSCLGLPAAKALVPDPAPSNRRSTSPTPRRSRSMSSSAVVAIYEAQAGPADERPRARRGPVGRQLRSRGPSARADQREGGADCCSGSISERHYGARAVIVRAIRTVIVRTIIIRAGCRLVGVRMVHVCALMRAVLSLGRADARHRGDGSHGNSGGDHRLAKHGESPPFVREIFPYLVANS